MLAHDRAALLGELAELVQIRHVPQAAEVEELEELEGRAVQVRPARLLLAAHDAREVVVEQHLEHRRAVDSADVIELGLGDRLAIRDDREGLELRARQPGGPLRQQRLHPAPVLGVRA
ncbi:MAG: hypothetical protein IPN32_24810 [Deltaproteobacteria bacterium]|nr:hypothetical protein [Deltaproteobacteria bacterium]